MTDQHDETLSSAPAEMPDIAARRTFLRSLGKWSQAVIGGVLLGGALTESRNANAWINGGGGSAGWINRYGGGGWVNRSGGGWVNRSGGAGWINGGGGSAGWINGGGGGGWVNRYGGGGWVNRSGGWSNRGGSWINRR